MEYIRLSENYSNNKLIPINQDPLSYVKNKDKPYFISMVKYNEDHYKDWKETNSLKGFKGGFTNKIWVDFDGKPENGTTLEQAFSDASIFCERLNNLGVKEENIELSFSGNKGIGIIVNVTENLTHEQVTNFCTSTAKGLKTFDTSMYDHQRIFRLMFTKNEKTGLYKIPITFDELRNTNVEEIKQHAKSLEEFDIPAIKSYYQPFTITPQAKLLLTVPVEAPKVIKPATPVAIDFTNKPKAWKDYKWAILQGHFESGERHTALLVLAATARGLGYDKETAYYLCKSALKKQASQSGSEEFPKEELWDNIIEGSIFSDNWEGGQYSPKNNLWLRQYCERMGFSTEEKEEPAIIQISDMSSSFIDYSSNFEKNIIKTGIKLLDDNVLLTTSSFNGLLGQPGAGKTSMALQFLEYTSSQGIQGVFGSLDMGKPIVYAKMVQRVTGLDFRMAIDLYRNNPIEAKRINDEIARRYKNIGFNFRSGVTVADLRNMVDQQQQTSGEKVKLLVVDYLERLAGPYSDATANGGYLANQLTDLSNDMEVCTLCLLQTQKHSVPDVSDPLLSLKGVKGSSIIEQGCSSILTLWRDGYNPKTVNDDRYISFALVKNRFSGLWSDDFAWHGVTGSISELSEEQRGELADFRKRKIEEKIKALKGDNQWD